MRTASTTPITARQWPDCARVESQRRTAPTVEKALRCLLLTAVVALTGCGGSGGGGNDRQEAGTAPPPPAPPAVIAISPMGDTDDMEANSARKVLDVLANDGDGVDGAEIQCVSASVHGASLKVSEDRQQIVYTPALGFYGTDEFRYQAADAQGNSGSAAVQMLVRATARADDASPVTPSPGVIRIERGAIPRMHDYATPEVLTPNQAYRVMQKPLSVDEVPPFTDDPRRQHILRLPLKRSQVYNIHVQFVDDGSFPPTGLHPTLSLIDAHSEVVENVVTTFDHQSIIRNYRPARSETQFLVVMSDKWPDDAPTRGSGDEDSYFVWAEIVDDNAGRVDSQAQAGGSFPVSGTLETRDDEDWFRVSLAGGVEQQARVTGLGASDRLRLTIRSVSDPYHWLDIGVSADGNSSAEVSVNRGSLGEMEDYFLVVEGDATGDYEITTAGGDVPRSTDTHAHIAPGYPELQAYIGGSGDYGDWYITHLRAGHLYYAEARTYPTRDGWMFSPAVGVYDETGSVLYDAATQYGDGGGCADPDCAVRAGVRFIAPYTGSYFIEASRFDRFSSGGFVALVLEDEGQGGVADSSADLATTARIETERLMAGVLETASDVDWYRVWLRDGEPLIVHARGESLGDLELQLFAADGTTVLAASRRNPDGSATLKYRGATGFEMGAVEVRSSGGTAGDYQLHREGGDPPPGTRNNPVIGFNGTVSGQISSREDEDVYRLSVVEGATYLFELEPDVNAPVPAQDFPWLELLDGSLRTFGDYAVLDADSRALSYTAPETGTIFVRVSNERRGSGARGGAYLLRARNTVEAELCEEF